MIEVDALRARLDAVDDALLALLAERAALVGALWAHKDAAGHARLDPAREAEIVARLRVRAAALGLDPEAVESVLRTIVGVDLRAEPDAS